MEKIVLLRLDREKALQFFQGLQHKTVRYIDGKPVMRDAETEPDAEGLLEELIQVAGI